MVHITIDGNEMDVPAGTTVLQATRMAGIEIPTLCDHPSLKPYGGCRLCVVEVEGARTLQASCTLPVYNNMVVHTATPKVRKAREFVLTLLFSERNHFCMYCEKTAGDCELQNAAYGEGMTHWPLQPNWKPYLVDASSPYFVFDHNRCILCRRCVRACAELSGNFTLAIENRGASSLVVADYGVPMGESSCISCGSCLQVCPTGALIDRAGAYLGPDVMLTHVDSICVGCSVGCGLDLSVRDNHLVRINGNWDAPVNAGVLCELGRFLSLEDDRARITTPLVRKDGALQPASWAEALAVVGARLETLRGRNGDGIAALVSSRLPAEALHAFKSLFGDVLGSTRLASIEEDQVTAYDVASPKGNDLDALKTADCVVVIGADLAKSHQVAGFFIKRNLPNGLRLIVIDPQVNDMDDLAQFVLRLQPGSDEALLRGIIASAVKLGLNKESAPEGFEEDRTELAAVSHATGIPASTIVDVAREISSARAPVFVYGKGLTRPDAQAARQALAALAQVVGGAALINPKGKANSFAAHCYDLDRPFNPRGSQAVYLALGDDYPSARLLETLNESAFIAVQASHVSPVTQRADVVLPVEAWTEQEGHYLNLEGRLQAAHKALSAPGEARSNLAVLQELANGLGASLDENWQAALSWNVAEFVG